MKWIVHKRGRRAGLLLPVVLAWLLPAGGLWALSDGNTESTIDPQVVAIDERAYLGVRLDGHYRLRDAKGQTFTLDRYRGKPLILLFSYYTCDGLCGTINRHLQTLIDGVQRFRPGRDFRVLTISFDKHDTLERIAGFRQRNHLAKRPGWTLAILDNPADIVPLTSSLGVRFFWSYRDRVFVHPNAFIFISPQGRVVRYLYGTLVSPRDVELALIDANWEKISTSGKLLNILAGVCFSYNFKEGRYTVNIPLFAGLGALLLGLVLVTASFVVAKKNLHRREATNG